jgi:hypothetical protein
MSAERVPGFRRVLVANGSDKTYLRHTSKHLRSNIGTPRVVGKIFSKVFFEAVESCDAVLIVTYGMEYLLRIFYYLGERRLPRK